MTLSEEEEALPFDVLVRKPRGEASREFIISLPKQVVDRLQIGRRSLLDLIVLDNFILLKRWERTSYREKPIPEILATLDEALSLYRELNLIRSRIEDGESGTIESEEKRVQEEFSMVCSRLAGISAKGQHKYRGLVNHPTADDVVRLVKVIIARQKALGDAESEVLFTA